MSDMNVSLIWRGVKSLFVREVKSSPISLAGCGGDTSPVRDHLGGDNSIPLTPDGGVAIGIDAFGAPESDAGGRPIPTTGSYGTDPDLPDAGPPPMTPGPIILTGERFSEGVVEIEIPLIEAPGLLENILLKAVITTDPTLIDAEPALPCVDGLLRLTLDEAGDYVSNLLDPASRPPLYLVSYRLVDHTGKVEEPAVGAVYAEDIHYLGVSCEVAEESHLNPGAVAFDVDIPPEFHQADSTLNASLWLTITTEPGMFVTGFESDYETRFVANLEER